MKINWKVRVKNPYFWIGLVAMILACVGISAESLTSWGILQQKIVEIANNPFAIGCIVVGIIGYINDTTTKGLSDSERALGYTEPN